MPTRTAAKKSPRKSAKRTPARTAKRNSANTSARSAARRPARASHSRPKSAAPKARTGLITHTELASADPPATRAWCERILGWKFGPSVPTPTGPYHMWRFESGTGGGIRANNPPEVPGSIPYCEVVDIRATFARALKAGAKEMVGPMALPSGMGWIAIVAAPGGVPIGFWATS